MFIKILIVLAVLIIVLGVVVALRPSNFRVARTAFISAPASIVFAEVNDLHKWEAWSPYEKLDPAMPRAYEGAPAGVGASYAWSGNRRIGAGRCTITDSRPSERIAIRLEMTRPFACTNAVEFTFRPDGRRTAATWSMTGKCNFVTKALSLFMSMDKMVGGEFDKGLAALKAISEAAVKT